tara:strand:- start:2015 stop:2971 length:957 start_codon:yes stop_codon:yes gene_type:complete
MKSKKTALVTGCTGQDGSLMCKSLLKKQWKVIGLSREEKNDVINHTKIGISKKVEIEKCEITDQKKFIKLLLKYQPDEIYNLAAQSSVGKSFQEPSETFKSIVQGTINILEACRKTNYLGRIFFAGSSEIFGCTDKAANIKHPKNPVSPYGISKKTSMELVELYRDIYNLKCCTGVLFNHESILRDERFVIKKIIKNALQAKINKGHIFSLGNINIIRDWGLAEEYVEAMQVLNRSKKIKDDVICTGKQTSLKCLIKEIFNSLNLNWKDHVKLENSLFRAHDIIKSYGDPTSMYKKHGWIAKTKSNGLIRKLIDHEIK